MDEKCFASYVLEQVFDEDDKLISEELKELWIFMISEELLNNIVHELNSITGLYASDNLEFKESFQLDFSELLEKIEKEKHS